MSEKRFPLLVGYAFVNIHQRDFEKVRGIEGVMCFMRPSPDRGPIAFRDSNIGLLMFADFQSQQQWEREREQRLAISQGFRRNVLNKRLGLVFPKGRRKNIPLRTMAEAAIDSMAPASRQQVCRFSPSYSDGQGNGGLPSKAYRLYILPSDLVFQSDLACEQREYSTAALEENPTSAQSGNAFRILRRRCLQALHYGVSI